MKFALPLGWGVCSLKVPSSSTTILALSLACLCVYESCLDQVSACVYGWYDKLLLNATKKKSRSRFFFLASAIKSSMKK